jgi:hypothetical protein
MTKQTLFDAINTMAEEIGLANSIKVSHEVFAPMQMSGLAAAAWVKNAPETESSKIVREQLLNLWVLGALKFD